MKISIIGTAWPYRGGLATFNERLTKEFIRLAVPLYKGIPSNYVRDEGFLRAVFSLQARILLTTSGNTAHLPVADCPLQPTGPSVVADLVASQYLALIIQ